MRIVREAPERSGRSGASRSRACRHTFYCSRETRSKLCGSSTPAQHAQGNVMGIASGKEHCYIPHSDVGPLSDC